MDLILTNHQFVQNTNFCNEAGQVLYKTATPGSILLPNRRTTISKIIPNESHEDMVDRFEELAVIQWRLIASSILTYGSIEQSMKDYMPSQGLFAQYRVFTAPVDGRSFKWTLGTYHSTLELNDDSKTPVARSHRSTVGIIGAKKPARLEILTGFEHLVDIILITYIYVEKLRKDRENMQKCG